MERKRIVWDVPVFNTMNESSGVENCEQDGDMRMVQNNVELCGETEQRKNRKQSTRSLKFKSFIRRRRPVRFVLKESEDVNRTSINQHDSDNQNRCYTAPEEHMLSTSTLETQSAVELERDSPLSPEPSNEDYGCIQTVQPIQSVKKAILSGQFDDVVCGTLERLKEYFATAKEETKAGIAALRSVDNEMAELRERMSYLTGRRDELQLYTMQQICDLSETEFAIQRLMQHYLESSIRQHDVNQPARTLEIGLTELEEEVQRTFSTHDMAQIRLQRGTSLTNSNEKLDSIVSEDVQQPSIKMAAQSNQENSCSQPSSLTSSVDQLIAQPSRNKKMQKRKLPTSAEELEERRTFPSRSHMKNSAMHWPPPPASYPEYVRIAEQNGINTGITKSMPYGYH